ncbi:MAG: hypothetical protein AAF613_04910 [Pseudomonadota bacterium]
MLRGLPASLVFHAAIVSAGYVAWPFVASERYAETELVIVPVDLIELGEVTNISAVRTPDPEPEVLEPEPEPEETPPEEEPEPEPDPVDELLPEDEIETARDAAPPPEETDPEDVLPDFDAEPEEPAPKEEEPEPEPKQPAPAVKKPVDPLADFLNSADSTFQSERETRKKQPEPKPEPKRLLEDTPPKPQAERRGAGERSGNTARLEALMYNAVRPCWTGVDDQPDPEKLNVRMSAELDKAGNLIDLRLVEPGRRPLGRSPMGVAVDRALRAVRKCAPYRLPEDEYDEWKYININLGPAFGPK